MPSRDYIVRVYRCDKKRPRRIIGIIEEVGNMEKKAFTNIEELWKILNPSAEIKIQEGKTKRETRTRKKRA